LDGKTETLCRPGPGRAAEFREPLRTKRARRRRRADAFERRNRRGESNELFTLALAAGFFVASGDLRGLDPLAVLAVHALRRS
jgi:hypothetical protein